MAIEDFYDATFTIYQRVAGVDNGGAANPKYSVKISSLSGRMRTLGGGEQILNMKTGKTATHRFYCSIQTITETDVIKDSSSRYYDITLVDNVHGLGRFLTIECTYNPSLQEEISENVS